MSEAENKVYVLMLAIFWAVFGLFVMVTSGMFLLWVPFRGLISGLPTRAALSILGLILVILSLKASITKKAKLFFILTGAAALGMGLSIILHNLLYALSIGIFGQKAWGNMGDEPFFFIMATIVCPTALLIGAIAVMVLMAKSKIRAT